MANKHDVGGGIGRGGGGGGRGRAQPAEDWTYYSDAAQSKPFVRGNPIRYRSNSMSADMGPNRPDEEETQSWSSSEGRSQETSSSDGDEEMQEICSSSMFYPYTQRDWHRSLYLRSELLALKPFYTTFSKSSIWMQSLGEGEGHYYVDFRFCDPNQPRCLRELKLPHCTIAYVCTRQRVKTFAHEIIRFVVDKARFSVKFEQLESNFTVRLHPQCDLHNFLQAAQTLLCGRLQSGEPTFTVDVY